MAEQNSQTRRVRPVSAMLACLALVAIAASVGVRPSARQPARSRSQTPAPTVSAHLAVEDSVGVNRSGVPQTADGARVAAIAYLRLSERVVTTDDAAAAEMQRAAAAASVADRLVAETLTKLAALRRSFPDGPVILRVAPLAMRVTMESQDRARTDIWHVDVVSPPGGTAYEQWRTSRYQLVWERESWRVSAETIEDGPRPLSAALPPPVLAADLEKALSGFEALR